MKRKYHSICEVAVIELSSTVRTTFLAHLTISATEAMTVEYTEVDYSHTDTLAMTG